MTRYLPILFAVLLMGCSEERQPSVGEVWFPDYEVPQPFFPVTGEVVILKVCGDFVLMSYTGNLYGYNPDGMDIKRFHRRYNYARPDTALAPCQ